MPAPVTNPLDVIDLPALEQEESIIAAYETEFAGTASAAAAGAGGVTAGGALLVLSAGALLDYDLLNNKGWNHFWGHVGSRLTDVFSAAGSFLFGNKGLDLDSVRLAIGFGLHLNMRAMRQLLSNSLGKVMAAQAALVASMRQMAKVVNHNALTTNTLFQAARAYALQVASGVEARAVGREHALEQRAAHYARAAAHDAVVALQHTVIHPLQTEVVTLRGKVNDLSKENASLRAKVEKVAIPDAALALSVARAASKAITPIATEVQECLEPMCETQGPNTDWGKLFRLFKPDLLLLMLTAVAALDPEVVEKAAEGAADAFGPILDTWAKKYVGLVAGGPGSILGDVAHEIGGIVGLF